MMGRTLAIPILYKALLCFVIKVHTLTDTAVCFYMSFIYMHSAEHQITQNSWAYVYRRRAKKSEVKEVKAKMNMISSKYTHLKESKLARVVMSMVDMANDQDQTTKTSKLNFYLLCN